MENNRDNILTLMIAHHALLDVLFELFKSQLKNESPGLKDSLLEFKWETQKHFFVEERGIFDFLPMRTLGVFKTISQLKEEHITMLNQLQKILDFENFQDIPKGDLNSFHDLTESHRKLEEEELYPKLDKDLSPDKKKEIISKINEIPLTKRKSS